MVLQVEAVLAATQKPTAKKAAHHTAFQAVLRVASTGATLNECRQRQHCSSSSDARKSWNTAFEIELVFTVRQCVSNQHNDRTRVGDERTA